MGTTLLIIDPQNDFCHPEWGTLYVPGAEQDMDRLTQFVMQFRDDIDSIVVSLDSHQRMDISHPLWWVDAHGAHLVLHVVYRRGGRCGSVAYSRSSRTREIYCLFETPRDWKPVSACDLARTLSDWPPRSQCVVGPP